MSKTKSPATAPPPDDAPQTTPGGIPMSRVVGPDGEPWYAEGDGCTWRMTRRGWQPLCNFTARVFDQPADILGLERLYRIEATTRDGIEATTVIPARQFAGMRWVTPKLGIDFLIYPGASRDHLRAAIQFLSSSSGPPPPAKGGPARP